MSTAVVVNIVDVTGSLALSEPITGTVGLSGPITGTVGLSGPISGTVGLSEAVSQGLSGSQFWKMTGSVALTEPISGSVAVFDASGNPIGVLLDGSIYRLQVDSLVTRISSSISAENSTTGTLGASAVFSGSAVEIIDFATISVAVFSDQASVDDGLSVQQSVNGTNWDFADDFTITANNGKVFTFNPSARYMRVVYENGPTPQGVFRLQTILHPMQTKSSTHRIQDSIVDDDDAELVKSVITGQDTAGTFRNVGVTEDGTLRVTTGLGVSGIVSAKIANSGTTNMNVNGTSPNLEFVFNADPVDDLLLQKITIVLVPNTLKADNVSFGSLAALTNGVRVVVVTSGSLAELGVFKITEDIVAFGDTTTIETGLSANDLLVSTLNLGGAKLIASSSDKLSFFIRDDLTTSGANSIKHFNATVFALRS